MTLLLAGRVAIVTGASRGIGFEIASVLAAAGAHIAMLARSRDTLEEGARLIGSEGPGKAVAIVCDVTDADQVAAAVRSAQDAFGEADILVNNAGSFALGTVATMATQAFVEAMHVNLVAPFILVKSVLPAMRARGTGHIVTIGSVADRSTFPENGAYAAAKHGVRALHEVIRQELRGSGVRATLVSPGPTDTPLWDAVDVTGREGFTPRRDMLRTSAVADAVLWCVTRPASVNVDELRLTSA